MPKCDKDCNTPKVLEIHNHECPVLFHRVMVPAAMGDDETNPPRNGQYRNVLLVYEANGHVYLFSSDGIPTFISGGGTGGVEDYEELLNKPLINGHELIGDSSLDDIGVTDAIDNALDDYTPTADLAAVALSGSYNDLTDKPADFELVEMSYGESNAWAKFIAAYQGHKIVYCRASSNASPATGSQTRKAFMAYVDNAENPTNVEFQYVRSVGSKTAAQPVDQVFIYALDRRNGGTWAVQTRDMAPKLAQGTNTTVSYANGTYTISATQPTVNNATLTIKKNGSSVGTFTANSSTNTDVDLTVPTKTSDLTNDSGFIDKNVSDLTNYYDETTVNSMFNALTIPTKTSDLTNDSGFLTSSTGVTSVNGNTGAVTGLQTASNLVTSVSSSSTNSQYPSAKLFYDTVGDVETILQTLNSGSGAA